MNRNSFQSLRTQDFSSVIHWQNTSEETVPAYGVVELVEYVAETNTYTITKPTAGGNFWLANGETPVPAGDWGASRLWHLPQHVLCSVSPDVGTGLAAEAGSWEMSEGGFVTHLAEVESGICSAIARGESRHFAVLVDDLPASPAIYATGTIDADSDQLTTSVDLSGYIDDYTVIICGAGVDGVPLVTTITAATSTVATLGVDATTAVTDADIGILAVADVWILKRNACGRLVQTRDAANALITVPVVNDFREIDIAANTLIGIEFQAGYWVPYKTDCDSSAWEWPAISE